MPELKLEGLSTVVAQKIRPFITEITNKYPENIHSIHVVGSAVTEDFNEKTSDINSVFVLKQMDLKFIELLAPLGKKYKKKGIAAPLIMTPEYINNSLDVFPMEFLDFKHIHKTVFGEDILSDIEIKLDDLRHQCERELKSKLIGLRQGYISSQGDKKLLVEGFSASINGYMPLFRAIIFLTGRQMPIKKYDVLSTLSFATGINTDIFKEILSIKKGTFKPKTDELDTIFEEYYEVTEKIGRLIDEHKV
jgi:predicted nucleotidyltransferase